ncbi:MAG: PEGA domain-containing protein [Bacteroidota bacterium]|jgi:hypothetical protein|nr:PEGA domain-containing protein [Ignavibacteria bacterium]MCU7500648.1 PEGA domain-containing protein [Ignavibacteria bacterium]MCU7512777.1 PEGA domain-containing protein [Ignavibacteria bacterium]MCU7520341.1 PEGA domain-containing protein [Ignavibacteria bacterium]MCU7523944.1 PEGA domain-containing protein [Ignavibacteria bacterium]
MLNRFFSVFLLLLLFQSRALPQDSQNVSSTVIDSTLGSITIKSRPAEARVFIDGSLRGVTPLKLVLPAGKYSLNLLKDGFESSFNSVEIRGAQTRTIDDSLYAVPKFKLTTVPANASIFIDSSYTGKSPVNDFLLSSGKHRLRVSLDGYEDLSMNLTLRPGDNAALKLLLIPNFGFLSLNVPPSGAEVFIDNVKMSPDRVSKLKLPAGEHDLRVFSPAIDRSIQERIYIAPRVESEVTAPLEGYSVKAALLSAVLPGLGQFLDGSYLKGSLEFLSTAGMGYLVCLANDAKNRKKTDLDLATLEYSLAETEAGAFLAREKLTRASSDLTTAKNKVSISIAALGAAYGLTILDALIFHSKEQRFYIKRTILPYEGLEKYGSLENIEMGVNLHF